MVPFLGHPVEVNLNKIMIKILQGSVVTQTMLGGSCCKFSMVGLCTWQKLWKLVGSRQSYCSNKRGALFTAYSINYYLCCYRWQFVVIFDVCNRAVSERRRMRWSTRQLQVRVFGWVQWTQLRGGYWRVCFKPVCQWCYVPWLCQLVCLSMSTRLQWTSLSYQRRRLHRQVNEKIGQYFVK